MLILTRRIGERLIIGEDVTISILSVKGHQIRIGIEAPRDVQIHREEVYLRILEERKTLEGPKKLNGAYSNGHFTMHK